MEEIKSGILTKEGRTYVCSCGCEALVIEFPEDDWDGYDFCNIAIWSSYNADTSWGQKFKYIWRILKYGHPYTDMICLNKKQVKKMNKYITKELNK